MSLRPTSESIGAKQQTPETERDNVTVHHVVILRGAITPRVRLISQHLQRFSPSRPSFYLSRVLLTTTMLPSLSVWNMRNFTNENLSANINARFVVFLFRTNDSRCVEIKDRGREKIHT